MMPFRGKLVLVLAALAVSGTLLYLMSSHQQDIPQSVPSGPHQPSSTRTVILFFDSPDARGLIRESRTIENCSGETPACLLTILKELAAGPAGNGAPVIPTSSTFTKIRLDGTTAEIDLDANFATGIPEGSAAEMAAVYGIVNTVVTNFPTITSVRFLQNGQPCHTLKGHLDLSKPLAADYSLERAVTDSASHP